MVRLGSVKWYWAALFFGVGVSWSPPGLASLPSQPIIDRCLALQVKIDQLQQRRRAGGSVQQMDRWLRQRHQYRDQQFELECARYKRWLTPMGKPQ